MSEDALAAADLADYCRTQARFLWGRVETLTDETEALLDEIADDLTDLQDSVAAHERPAGESPDTPSPTAPEQAVDDLEARERDIEEKQAVAEAKQARRDAFDDLATAYVELADDLADTADTRAALTRVVEFERDRDAPAYFEERETLLETVAGASDGDSE
ncbi:hypothetical protein ACFQL1_16740 [Halomicroarcula sp. GCM10025709]|uniref:hypothetical protein n=1 Tax=Haloarcula TaxID=2237 RepID=UPI0024C39318|nr:hypothetical protein [Halomicroarcula sp. YJ-61-S]